jgi:branched-chain amino acid transport system ATP-binding protein
MTLLNVSAIETFYGPSQALFGVDLEVGDGEVVALMGRNGMGKTTTIRSVCGMTPARAGRILFAGEELTGLPSHRIARKGIGLVPEGRRCFPNLTVGENLVVSARPGRWTVTAVEGLFPRLGERRAQYATTLSGGEQQMLAIGRALMAKPTVLLLDEPSLGLSPILIDAIFTIIQEINAQGTTVLLVEQNALKALDVANRGYVIQTGNIVLTGSAKELLGNDMVRKAYLGED